MDLRLRISADDDTSRAFQKVSQNMEKLETSLDLSKISSADNKKNLDKLTKSIQIYNKYIDDTAKKYKDVSKEVGQIKLPKLSESFDVDIKSKIREMDDMLSKVEDMEELFKNIEDTGAKKLLEDLEKSKRHIVAMKKELQNVRFPGGGAGGAGGPGGGGGSGAGGAIGTLMGLGGIGLGVGIAGKAIGKYLQIGQAYGQNIQQQGQTFRTLGYVVRRGRGDRSAAELAGARESYAKITGETDWRIRKSPRVLISGKRSWKEKILEDMIGKEAIERMRPGGELEGLDLNLAKEMVRGEGDILGGEEYKAELHRKYMGERKQLTTWEDIYKREEEKRGKPITERERQQAKWSRDSDWESYSEYEKRIKKKEGKTKFSLEKYESIETKAKQQLWTERLHNIYGVSNQTIDQMAPYLTKYGAGEDLFSFNEEGKMSGQFFGYAKRAGMDNAMMSEFFSSVSQGFITAVEEGVNISFPEMAESFGEIFSLGKDYTGALGKRTYGILSGGFQQAASLSGGAQSGRLIQAIKEQAGGDISLWALKKRLEQGATKKNVMATIALLDKRGVTGDMRKMEFQAMFGGQLSTRMTENILENYGKIKDMDPAEYKDWVKKQKESEKMGEGKGPGSEPRRREERMRETEELLLKSHGVAKDAFDAYETLVKGFVSTGQKLNDLYESLFESSERLKVEEPEGD